MKWNIDSIIFTNRVKKKPGHHKIWLSLTCVIVKNDEVGKFKLAVDVDIKTNTKTIISSMCILPLIVIVASKNTWPMEN